MAFIKRWNEKDGHPFNWTFRGYPMQFQEMEAVRCNIFIAAL